MPKRKLSRFVLQVVVYWAEKEGRGKKAKWRFGHDNTFFPFHCLPQNAVLVASRYYKKFLEERGVSAGETEVMVSKELKRTSKCVAVSARRR